MPQFVAVLILVPTLAALAIGVAYIIGALVSFFAAGIDGLVVAIRHRMHPVPARPSPPYHRPALHH